MFLLKRSAKIERKQVKTNLHSTMFLLKLNGARFTLGGAIWFTFHNVSIKTSGGGGSAGSFDNLHSTMFLLKHRCLSRELVEAWNLHSTMFLLKPTPFRNLSKSNLDLHSTMFLLKPKRMWTCTPWYISFTFHNVSIKTWASALSKIGQIVIYIPQCFY